MFAHNPSIHFAIYLQVIVMKLSIHSFFLLWAGGFFSIIIIISTTVFIILSKFLESVLGILEGDSLPVDLLAFDTLPEFVIEVIVPFILPVKSLLSLLLLNNSELGIVAFHTS